MIRHKYYLYRYKFFKAFKRWEDQTYRTYDDTHQLKWLARKMWEKFLIAWWQLFSHLFINSELRKMLHIGWNFRQSLKTSFMRSQGNFSILLFLINDLNLRVLGCVSWSRHRFLSSWRFCTVSIWRLGKNLQPFWIPSVWSWSCQWHVQRLRPQRAWICLWIFSDTPDQLSELLKLKENSYLYLWQR